MCFSSFFAIIWQKMKKNTSWKFTDESSVTFQSSIRGPGEFGLIQCIFRHLLNEGENHMNFKTFKKNILLIASGCHYAFDIWYILFGKRFLCGCFTLVWRRKSGGRIAIPNSIVKNGFEKWLMMLHKRDLKKIEMDRFLSRLT